MFRRPKLRSHLRLDVAAPDLVVVRSEDGSSVHEGRLLPLLVPYLDGTWSVEQIVERLAARAGVVDVHFGLSLLAEEGLLAEDGAEAPLGLEAEDFPTRSASTAVEVRALGEIDPEPLSAVLASLGIRVVTGGDLMVVLTPDFLRCELAEVNRRAIEQGRAWLLVKPVGLILWIGPLFLPRRTPCWACLASRLEENQPFRELLPGNPISLEVPSLTLPSTLAMAWNAAATQVLRWVGSGHHPDLEGRLITLDVRTLASRGHVVVRQPFCAQCGAPPPAINRLPEPIRLSRGPRGDLADGGYRVEAPDATYRRLEHHVSPITGPVSWVRDHSDPLFRPPVPESHGAGSVRLFVADHVFRGAEPREALTSSQRRRSAGKGISAQQARTSALCEALERYSGLYRGDEPRVTGRFADLGAEAVHPNSCLGYSTAQYREREAWNHKGLRYSWVPVPLDEDQEIEWTPLWSLTEHRVRYLPTSYCYFGVPSALEHRFCLADSNGNAAGNTLEEAILQGFLELVERDAVAMWWYNRARRPGVSLESFDKPYFAALTGFYRALQRDLHVLDVTGDFTIPTFAAVSWAAGSRTDLLLGFGAHFDAEIAVARALTEMNQFLPAVLEGRERMILSEPVAEFAFLEPNGAFAEKRQDEYEPVADRDLRDVVLRCVELARRKELEVLVLDQTRADVGLSVVKVVVPGLRHYWPRFGPGRLYSTPVELGWLASPLSEEELNQSHVQI